MKRLISNILLFLLGLFLLLTVGVIGLLITLYSSIRYWNKKDTIKYWGDVFYELAMGVDKFGNVLLGSFLNTTAIITTDIPFGKINHTISHILALNYQANNLTSFGKAIVWLLETFDNGHIINFNP